MATNEVIELAAKVVAKSRQAFANYDEEVKAWYKANPGYQFPVCPHGTSLITDYDPMCGHCEDGYSFFHYETEARDALEAAKYAVAQRDKRVEAVTALLALGATWSDLENPEKIGLWIKQPTTIS